MSDDLARARVRKAADDWLAGQEYQVPLPPKRIGLTPDSFRTFMLEAFVAGASYGDDEHAIRVATGQAQLDDATSLMTEAVELLRGYEKHHREQAEIADTGPRRADRNEKANRNGLMAARLEAWLKGEDIYPVTVDRPTLAGFHDGGVVKGPVLHDGDVPAVLRPDLSWPTSNPARVLAQIGETMVDGVTIKGVDHESFDRAAEWLDQPVEISALDAPPMSDRGVISKIWADAVAEHEAPAQSLADDRRAHAELCSFTYWPGGDGPPDDWDCGDVLLDWADTALGPRFTVLPGKELAPHPGLWSHDLDTESYGIIIGYRPKGYVDLISPPTDFPSPGAALAKGKVPANLVADEPDPLAALVHARNWLISAESLIAEASAFIRGVTGANPGSDSADLCHRLDAWLTPMAEQPPATEEN